MISGSSRQSWKLDLWSVFLTLVKAIEWYCIIVYSIESESGDWKTPLPSHCFQHSEEFRKWKCWLRNIVTKKEHQNRVHSSQCFSMPDMSRKGVLLLEDEVKKEYEVLPKGPKGASKEELKPLLTSKPLLPHLSSSSCCDIPVVFSRISSRRRQGQPYSVSKNLLSAISPWLASLIQGASLVHSEAHETNKLYHLIQLSDLFL